MEIFLNFTHRDLHFYDAKFGLVKFEITALISLYKGLNLAFSGHGFRRVKSINLNVKS